MNYGVWGLEQGGSANIFDPAVERVEIAAVFPEMFCAI